MSLFSKALKRLEELERFYTRFDEVQDVQDGIGLAFQLQYANQANKVFAARPKIRELAEYTNEILQSPEIIRNFMEELILKSLLSDKNGENRDRLKSIERNLAEPGRLGSPWGVSRVIKEVEAIAREAGWRGIVEVDEDAGFFESSVKQKNCHAIGPIVTLHTPKMVI